MAKKTTYAGKVYKNATKVRLRQIKAGKPISMAQAKQKARQMVNKRKDANKTVDVQFKKLATGTPYVTRKSASTSKTGPTAKTRTVRRIAERRGITRKEANAIRKARK